MRFVPSRQVLLLKIAISAITNGLYDAILECGMTCPCVQTGVPPRVRDCCEALSVVQLAVQLAGGIIVAFLGLKYLWENEKESFTEDILTSIKELIIGKVIGLFVVTMLVETITFMFGRRAQMKPDRDEVERLAVWNAPSAPKFPFCYDKRFEGEPPCTMWNTFIGEKNHYIELPERAPTYDIDAKFFCWVIYSETATDNNDIPRWFLSDMNKPATRIQKWLRSDNNPRLVGQEHLWENQGTFLPSYMAKSSQVAPETSASTERPIP